MYAVLPRWERFGKQHSKKCIIMHVSWYTLQRINVSSVYNRISRKQLQIILAQLDLIHHPEIAKCLHWAKNNKHTSITFIHINFTMVTRPPGFAQAIVLWALARAKAIVFTGIQITRVFFTSFWGLKTCHMDLQFQRFAQEFLKTREKKNRSMPMISGNNYRNRVNS